MLRSPREDLRLQALASTILANTLGERVAESEAREELARRAASFALVFLYSNTTESRSLKTDKLLTDVARESVFHLSTVLSLFERGASNPAQTKHNLGVIQATQLLLKRCVTEKTQSICRGHLSTIIHMLSDIRSREGEVYSEHIDKCVMKFVEEKTRNLHIYEEVRSPVMDYLLNILFGDEKIEGNNNLVGILDSVYGVEGDEMGRMAIERGVGKKEVVRMAIVVGKSVGMGEYRREMRA